VPDLHGDADRLQQVLLNLARNAQEAGAQTLTLRTRVEHGLRWATACCAWRCGSM
jgi:two-component system nitrogen regulation sensor histidine kinase GlnL